MRVILANTKTNQDIQDAVNKHKELKVYGVSPSGALYHIENNTTQSATTEDVAKAADVDFETVNSGVLEITINQKDFVALESKIVKTDGLSKGEKVELNSLDIVENVEFELLEQRVIKLEKQIALFSKAFENILKAVSEN